MLPTLFIIGLIFAPIGALIVWGSGKVTTITLDYTQCDVDAPTGTDSDAMPNGKYSCESVLLPKRVKPDSHRRSRYWLLGLGFVYQPTGMVVHK